MSKATVLTALKNHISKLNAGKKELLFIQSAVMYKIDEISTKVDDETIKLKQKYEQELLSMKQKFDDESRKITSKYVDKIITEIINFHNIEVSTDINNKTKKETE